MRLAVPLADRVSRLADLEALDDGWRALAANAGDAVPTTAREAAAAALDRGETHYTDRPGIARLRESVARRLLARHGLPIDAGEVVITCGVTEARFVAIQQLLPGREGTVVALGRPERLAGACAIRDVALVGPEADAPGGAVLLYVPSDADPASLEAWLERARDLEWPILAEVDETEAPHPARAGLADRTITVGDVTAPFGAEAWRVGFLAAPAVTVGPLRDFKQALTICTTNVSQWGALALLEEES